MCAFSLVPINQLQLRIGLATGGSAAASLAVTPIDGGGAIASGDIIKGVLHFTTAAAIATLSYVALSEVTIPAAGYIACSTTDTSSDQLVVFWHDANI